MLGDVLFPPGDTRRTTTSLIAWWERRRITFNVMVGGAGLITLLFVYLISFIPPSAHLPLDWRPIAVYAVLANVCYTFGWAIEALAQRIWGEKCPRFGPALFRQGLVFSMGLTLLPILLMSFVWVVRAAMWLFLG